MLRQVADDASCHVVHSVEAADQNDKQTLDLTVTVEGELHGSVHNLLRGHAAELGKAGNLRTEICEQVKRKHTRSGTV